MQEQASHVIQRIKQAFSLGDHGDEKARLGIDLPAITYEPQHTDALFVKKITVYLVIRPEGPTNGEKGSPSPFF